MSDYFESDPIFEEPDWYGNEVTLQDGWGELHSYTLATWHEILLMDGDDIAYFYGLDHIQIIRDFEAQGWWTADDWEEWRDAYASTHGV